MFRYTLSAAILHREDTRDILIPAPYEVYPYYYVDSEVIQEAQKYWMQRKLTSLQPLSKTGTSASRMYEIHTYSKILIFASYEYCVCCVLPTVLCTESFDILETTDNLRH